MAVKGTRRYAFFSVDGASAEERGMVVEDVMPVGNREELNQIYVIFSPQLFTKAVDYAGEGVQPRELPYEEFQQWLFNCRKQDREMRVEVKHIVISD